LKHQNLQLQDEYEPIELIHLANDLGFNEFNKGYYTTTNYIVLGLILEEVTGHSWAEEFHSRIIVPLNLTQTYYAGEPGVIDTMLAANYTKEGTNANVAETIHPSVGWAAGGIVSNIPDLLSFYEALLDGTLLHNRSILRQAMTPIVKAEPDTKIHQYASFSLCLHQYNLNEMTLLGHYGSFGFHSHMLYDSTLQLIYIDTSNSMNAEEGFEDVEQIIRYLRTLK
jgi:CubicO group peptidase (beta-lactamase class C family)